MVSECGVCHNQSQGTGGDVSYCVRQASSGDGYHGLDTRMTVYSESERPWFAWIFVIVLLNIVARYANCGSQIFEKGWDPENGVIPFVMTGIPAFVVLGFLIRTSWTYFVREDGFGLHFGFSEWSVRFDYSDIIEAKRVDVRWTSWWGFGWRWRPRGIGYIVRNGPGVQISTKRSNRAYTFNCRDCDAMLSALGKAGVALTNFSDRVRPDANSV